MMEYTKNVAKKGWERFTNALAWLRDQVASGARWLWIRTKRGGAASKDAAQRTGRWSARVAERGWSWLGSATAGAREFISPVTHWLATPFRTTLGTSLGLATLLIFGAKFIVLVGLPWAIYAMISGRRLRRDHGVIVTPDGEAVPAPEPMVLSEYQRQALDNRELELDRELAEKKTRTPAQLSRLMGQKHMVTERQRGNLESADEIFKNYRASHEAMAGGSPERLKDINWSEVRAGIRSENSLIKRMLATTADSQGAVVLEQLAHNGGN